MTDERETKRHPIQPVADDGTGVLRFKKNPIVQKLLDDGPFDLNHVAQWLDVTHDDRRQFAQLIGYSLCGFGELWYCDEETYEAAERMARKGKSELEARVEYLEELIHSLKIQLREPVALLYGRHPDDLMEDSEDDKV